MPYKNKEDRRINDKRRNELRLSLGICVRCAKVSAIPGKRLCEACNNKFNEWQRTEKKHSEKSKENQRTLSREWNKKVRLERKLIGLCTYTTTCKEKAVQGMTRCLEHALQHNKECADRRVKYKVEGKCPICGVAVSGELTHCRKCIDRASNNHQKDKIMVMEAYGAKCSCCGESQLEFLTIDHINLDGKVHRKTVEGPFLYKWLIKNNFPKDNFRVLCYNCNIVSYRNNGFCPHNKLPSSILVTEPLHGTRCRTNKHCSKIAGRGKICEDCCNRVKLNYHKIKNKVFDHYGCVCSCCGETNRLFLSIDHINLDGKQHRELLNSRDPIALHRWLIKNDFPEGFRIMCLNCNIVSYRFNGVCPHNNLEESI